MCQFCGHDYRAQATKPGPHEKTVISLIGGILILVAGIMGLALGAILLTIDLDQLDQYGIDVVGATDILEDIMTICGSILVIFGLIAVLGGAFGVMRKHFGLVVLGGVFGLLCLGPWFAGSILALIGLVLVLVAKKDFE